MKKLVVIESPFAGADAAERGRNKAYLNACLRDSLLRDEAPFASHRLYTEALDDDVAEERKLGMDAGWEWMTRAELVAVYTDRGISGGMRAGIERASSLQKRICFRELGGEWGSAGA